MLRFLKLPVDIVEYEDQTTISIGLEYEAVAEWCLDLCLLEKDLVQSLAITNNTRTFKLTISKNPLPLQAERGKVKWHLGGVEILVSQTELDMWLDYFLRYYRDGIASVNHIDVDISSEGNEKGLFITFEVSSAALPVSKEEARRRLDL